MNKFNELLNKLKALKINQTNISWEENIPDDIWKEYFHNNYKEVDCSLNIDTHRWYELSITVIEIFGRYLGIRHVTNIFSESSGIDDLYVEVEFMEMIETTVTTYKTKYNV